jgi:hypothetical protein
MNKRLVHVSIVMMADNDWFIAGVQFISGAIVKLTKDVVIAAYYAVQY